MPSVPHSLKLAFPWLDKEREAAGLEELEIGTRYPLEHYGAFPGTCAVSSSQEAALHWRDHARAVITFMDATDLHAADTPRGLFHGDPEEEILDAEPEFFDHTRYWRDASDTLLITTEPYDDNLTGTALVADSRPAQIVRWCAERNWACRVMPPGLGLWRPAGGTRLVLMAPEPHCAAVERVAAILLDKLPRVMSVH